LRDVSPRRKRKGRGRKDRLCLSLARKGEKGVKKKKEKKKKLRAGEEREGVFLPRKEKDHENWAFLRKKGGKREVTIE